MSKFSLLTNKTVESSQPNDYRAQTLPTTYNGNGPVYDPAYPFGFGLSYSTFDSSVSSVVSSHHGVTVRVGVQNTGSKDGSVVVPVYVSQPVSPVLVPAKRLAGFTRVQVNAGQSTTVTVRVPWSALAVVPGDVDASGTPRVEHGTYVFSTGPLTTAATATAGNSLRL